MAFNPADPSSWPPRMVTSEVAEVMRLSKRIVISRERDGSLGFAHVDNVRSGKDLIFARADVMHAVGLGAEDSGTAPDRKNHDHIDPIKFRAALEAARKPKSRAKPTPPPTDAESQRETRAFGLAIHSGIDVAQDEEGAYLLRYVRTKNLCPPGWPPVIRLPRADPVPVRLDTNDEYLALLREIEQITQEWKKARMAEKA